MGTYGTAWGRWLLAGTLCLALGAGGARGRLWADDVPAPARKEYDSARALYLKGDAKSLAAAFSALSQAKARAGESVDFWELFVRVWRANKKPETDLWEKLIAPREQATPQSPAFDLVRFRLETDAAQKRVHLEKAVAKDPKAVAPRLLLAKELRAQGEEDKAEELVDALLEEQPALEEALVTKVDLMLAGGLSRVALKFAEERLAKQECPGLRHALARAQRNLAAEEAEMRAKALANAEKAVAGRADPEYVALLADLLDESDRMPEAVALLRKHAAATPDARLGARLGGFAWRSGDYDEAARQLAASAGSDLQAAKALALAHARRNRPKEALAAVDQVLALDKAAWAFAADVAQELIDPAALRKAIAGQSGEGVDWYNASAAATEGKALEVQRLLGAQAADGSRAGEEALLLLLRARLHAKLGAKLTPHLRQWRETRAKVVGGMVASAKPWDKPQEMKASSSGFMERAVTYLRSVCGTWFEVEDMSMAITLGSTMSMSFQVELRSTCAREPSRVVNFPLGEGGSFSPGEVKAEAWKAAEEAFQAGCAALVAEDHAKAAEAFGKAVEQESTWHRAKVFRDYARAFMPGSDLGLAARSALEAAGANPDDWTAQALAVRLGVLAGVDASAALTALLTHADARARPPLGDL